FNIKLIIMMSETPLGLHYTIFMSPDHLPFLGEVEAAVGPQLFADDAVRRRGVGEDPVEVVADGGVGGVAAARLGEQQVDPGEACGDPAELGLGATGQFPAEAGGV